jgi:succinate dehydrogenase / fumarate reductase, cytochrome b subunit
MRARQAFSSSVGTKILIALTGIALVGFLIVHLAGNLLLFWGPAKFNDHAHSLISNPLVVPAEIGLLAIFLLHVAKALANFFKNRGARSERYETKAWAGGASRKSWASTTMIFSGLLTLIFVPIHLITFKYGPHYAGAEQGVRDLFRLVVEVFQSPVYVFFYVVSMVVLGMHLRHGVSSSLQSLGLIPARFTRVFLAAGWLLALAVAVGFLSIPVYIYLFVHTAPPVQP